MIEKSRAQGVIFVLLKFCDPHAFDFPYIKELLDRQGIPSLLLEIEDQQTSLEQLKTRVEAFIELL
jgi:benzoyl-CoA reductase/2-hydroxyglutaryl-CoA dehydratase subunit BcrC/BadD/HgdB